MSLQVALRKLAPTPTELLGLYASVAGLNIADTDQFGNRISDRFLRGDFNSAFNVASNASRSFLEGGLKRKQLMDLITQVGVAKVLIALTEMVIKEFKV